MFLVVAACGGLYLGFTRGNLVAPWQSPPVPWDEMEAIARTFPVPEGFTAGEQGGSGRYCALIEVTCDSPPMLHMTVTRNASGESPLLLEERCEILDQSMKIWARTGIRNMLRQSEAIQNYECVYFGDLGSFRISTYWAGESDQSIEIVIFG
ncbi:MAG: hypothetical protein ACSLFB_09700 [Acidimicrobiales bacterium]